jgi:hypothetical protein
LAVPHQYGARLVTCVFTDGWLYALRMDLHPYRNTANGLVGYLTHEQAAVFPELLELVGDDDVAPEAPALPVVPAEPSVFSVPVLTAPGPSVETPKG